MCARTRIWGDNEIFTTELSYSHTETRIDTMPAV